jgi:hypothetical protein
MKKRDKDKDKEWQIISVEPAYCKVLTGSNKCGH